MQQIDQALDDIGKKSKYKTTQSSKQLQQFEQYFDLQKQSFRFSTKKEVQCPYENCDKTFKHKSLMILHARTHTGDKPFKCQFCEQRFITKGNKKDHERRHLNLKLFECDGCKIQFYRSNQLKKHLLTCKKAKALEDKKKKNSSKRACY